MDPKQLPSTDANVAINKLSENVKELGKLNRNLNKKVNNMNVNNNTLSNNANILDNNIPNNTPNIPSTTNIAEPVETFTTLSFCTKLLWSIPVIVSIIQIVIWANNLYKTHILKQPTELELSRKRQKEIETKLDELKKLLKK